MSYTQAVALVFALTMVALAFLSLNVKIRAHLDEALDGLRAAKRALSRLQENLQGSRTLPEFPDAISEDAIKAWYDEVKLDYGSMVEALYQRDIDINHLKHTIENADIPNIATRQIRERIEVQAERADKLHDTALKQNRLFQWLGILSVLIGLSIIGCAAFAVIFQGLEPDKVKFIAPVAGLVFNAVGGGLLLFHRATSHTAFRYYEQKQGLDNLLTALELMTNRVMKEQTSAMMPELIRRLYAHVGVARAVDVSTTPAVVAPPSPKTEEPSS